MEGITFNEIQEAKEYQNQMRQQGYLTKITKIQRKYKVTKVGDAPEWKDPSIVQGFDKILNDED
jgi:hypothetical protein